ncbi:MAG: hypothetical protein K2X07_14420, partial [Caulobacteraceae bacterium]|nr:hypothetical protein [Caulobacteraceae bacterium]
GALAWARASAAVVGIRTDLAVLHRLGADPRRLALLTLGAALPLVLVATLAGGAGAAALAAGWKLLAGGGQAASALPVGWSDLALALAAPATALPAAAVGAMRLLRETLGAVPPQG